MLVGTEYTSGNSRAWKTLEKAIDLSNLAIVALLLRIKARLGSVEVESGDLSTSPWAGQLPCTRVDPIREREGMLSAKATVGEWEVESLPTIFASEVDMVRRLLARGCRRFPRSSSAGQTIRILISNPLGLVVSIRALRETKHPRET
jgi:hypothetical protein